ncbi:proteoglycan 4-like [Zingiber officinale]|uniref:proteoglycan 4-like n=1 Tax=Zingiber officinale TaxID=94328 RepID=UPI001C4C9C4E|nr:proteoglycan 4-like [Zingiber officinale]
MNRSTSLAPPSSRDAVTKSADEELALFLEMRRLVKERNDLLLHNSEELDPPSGSKPGIAPLFRIASLSPLRKSCVDDFLNSDSEKNDYDWLLTPPTTPLFPSLDTESRRSLVFRNDTPKAPPKMLEFKLSNARDLSKNTSLRQPTLSSGINSSIPGTSRPSSSGGPTRSASRPATPNGHSTKSASSKPTRSSTPTLRSTLPLKTSSPPSLAPPRSATPTRSSTPTSRPPLAPPRSATPTRSSTPTSRPSLAPPRLATPTRSSTSTSRPSLAPPRSATPTRSSTPTSRAPLTPAVLPRPLTPVRSSIHASRSSAPAINKPASRPATPTRRPSTASTAHVSSIPIRQSSTVIRPNPMIPKSPVPATPKNSASTVSKSSASSARSSPIIKPKPLKPSEIPGFSLNAPANLKTSFSERSSMASRGRPGMPSSRSSSVELATNTGPRRQSCSLPRGRTAAGNVLKGSSVPPPSTQQTGSGSNVNLVVRGNETVEHIVNTRRFVPAKRDNQQQTHNDLPGKLNAGFERALSKKSLDVALRHTDIPRNIPNCYRPLMAKIPASSVCSVRSGSSRGRVGSISDSLGTSSPASSELSINNMFPIDDSEIEDELASEKSLRCSPAAPTTR